MSVDERLRDGLRNGSWTPDPTTAYASVVADARRTRVRRNLTIGGVTAAALLVTALAVAAPEEQPRSTQPASVPSGRPSGDASRLFPTSTLDGHWHTAPLDRRETRDVFRAGGLGDVFDRWSATHPGARPRLTMAASSVFPYGLWLGSTAQPYAEIVDWGAMTVRGHRVLLVAEGGGSRATLSWTRTGDRVAFDVVRADWPTRQGFSGATQVRALYATETFVKFVGAGFVGSGNETSGLGGLR